MLQGGKKSPTFQTLKKKKPKPTQTYLSPPIVMSLNLQRFDCKLVPRL